MVAINREQHIAVRGALWWDKRKETGASHGRGLRHDLPSLGLLKNDRLEPWGGMLDAGEFDSWDAFPRTVLFWRSSRQTSTKHRNPICSATTGIQPNTSLSVCWLHTLSLGPLQVYSVHVVHRLVAASAWQVDATTKEAKLAMSVMRMREELTRWYAAERRAGRNPTEINGLDTRMFGSEVDPQYKLKGAEANWFVGFVVLLLEQRGHVLGEERQILLALGQDLLRLLDLMRIHLFQFPPDAHQARSDRSVLSRLIIDRGHLGPISPLPPTADHREAFVDHTIHAQRMWALCN